ncbi:MAG: hypothetical protein OEU54_09500 [Gemmatimonadota bacterium]|nr:hypothetical protein [Gemmatimonadota bacterium]
MKDRTEPLLTFAGRVYRSALRPPPRSFWDEFDEEAAAVFGRLLRERLAERGAAAAVRFAVSSTTLACVAAFAERWSATGHRPDYVQPATTTGVDEHAT